MLPISTLDYGLGYQGTRVPGYQGTRVPGVCWGYGSGDKDLAGGEDLYRSRALGFRV